VDVDDARIRFVFGDDDVVDDYDIDDRSERDLMLEEHFSGFERFEGAVRSVLANQILDDNPSETWNTVVRLNESGHADGAIWGQLSIALSRHLQAVMRDEVYDDAAYRRDLARLPMPPREMMFDAFALVSSAEPGLHSDTAIERVMAAVSLDVHDPTDQRYVEMMMEHAVRNGVIDFVGGDGLVSVSVLADGVTLSRTLTADEVASGNLELTFDLALFVEAGTVSCEGREVRIAKGDADHAGIEGVLTGFTAGQTVAVSLDGHTLTISQIDRPPCDPELVERVREMYDRDNGMHGMPVSGRDLLVELRFEYPDLFATPNAPLSDLVAAADLELRCHEVAHSREPWRAAEALGRYGRLDQQLNDPLDSQAVARAIEVADPGPHDDDHDHDEHDEAFGPEHAKRLRDWDVFDCLRFELFTLDDDPSSAMDRLADAIDALSHHRSTRAVAEHLRSDASFERADLAGALDHITKSNELDPTWEPAADRRGLFAFVMGDAKLATRLWRHLPEREAEVASLGSIFASGGGPAAGRNDPCPCGSGRKFKQCHQNLPVAPSAAASVTWLWSKAFAALTSDSIAWSELDTLRTISESSGELSDHQRIVVIDFALHEEDGFLSFLEDWGDLLPAGERALASSWTTTERDIYEVVTRDPIAVRSRATRETIKVAGGLLVLYPAGTVFCGRLVDDANGGRHFLPGTFEIDLADEAELRGLIDDGDSYSLAGWLSRRRDSLLDR
jgi:hypothetical protein